MSFGGSLDPADLGHLVWLSVAGLSLSVEERELARRWQLGGAVLFRHNLRSLEQSRALVAQLRDASSALAFVAVDQEGGRVTRLPAPATSFPSAMAQAATGDPSLAEAAARATGRELRAFGITVNLAPVLDLGVNPLNPSVGTRAFGERPETVSAFGTAQVRGSLAGGVLPVAKHFPGHGNTPVDSHLALPVLDVSLADLRQRDLPPFLAAVRAGAPLLMMGHVAYSAIDASGLPATLSPGMIRLARQEVGFGGLLLTDALRMQAVADRWTMAEAALLSVQAGADVALPLRDEPDVLQGLFAAVRAGVLGQERVAEARAHSEEARRLLASLPDSDPSAIPWQEHAELARTIARRSIAVVRDERGWLPLRRSARTLVVEMHVSAMSQVEEGELPSVLSDPVRRFAPDTRGIVAPAAAVSPADRGSILAAAREADQVVLATREALILEPQAAVALEVLSLGKPTILVALRSPTDLAAYPIAPAFVAALSDVPASMLALAETLFGELQPTGKLPVGIPGIAEVAP